MGERRSSEIMEMTHGTPQRKWGGGGWEIGLQSK